VALCETLCVGARPEAFVALSAPGRVAIQELKDEGILRRRCRVRQCKYLNNIIEQDHRTVRRRAWLAMGYGSFRSASRTLQGIEAVNMIRKGRIKWVAKEDPAGQARFVGKLFGIAA
jgi:transposase, IS6 family